MDRGSDRCYPLGMVSVVCVIGNQYACIYSDISCAPLIITGGFHVDGFMDTMDALHSYQPRERKLEILKDSHIGAFSVIKLAEFGLIYVAALSQIVDYRALEVFCCGFSCPAV